MTSQPLRFLLKTSSAGESVAVELGTFVFGLGLIGILAGYSIVSVMLFCLETIALLSLVFIPLVWLATLRRWNFVELRDHEVYVRMQLNAYRLPLNEVTAIDPDARHFIYSMAFGFLGTIPLEGHVEILAVKRRRPWFNRFRLSWTRRTGHDGRLHLSLKQPQEFLAALQRRLDVARQTQTAA